FLTHDDVERMRHFRHLAPYLRRKEDDLREWNEKLGERNRTSANTRRLTNVGTPQAYAEAYLRGNPRIHQGMTLLVRQLQPGREGLPIELCCFTNTTAWADYESIQSDIFDHLFALLPEFGLRVFQDPTGGDVRHLARQNS